MALDFKSQPDIDYKFDITIRCLVPDADDREYARSRALRELKKFHPTVAEKGLVLVFTIKKEFNHFKHLKKIQKKMKEVYNGTFDRSDNELWYSIQNAGVVHSGSAGFNDWEKNIPKLAGSNIPNYLWNHDAIRIKQAMAKLTTLDTTLGHKASGIRVFQFDTGWSDHPDIHSYEGYTSADKQTGPDDQKLSQSFLKRPKTAGEKASKDELQSLDLASVGFQKSGHGTATAYTVIGKAGLPSSGWPEKPKVYPEFDSIKLENLSAGLFPYVEFIPIKISKAVTMTKDGKVLSKWRGNPDNLVDALAHVVKNKGHVVTMSIGGEIGWGRAHDACEAAYKQGVIMVMAAGNNKTADNVFNVVKPGQFPETICPTGYEPKWNEEKQTIELLPWAQACDGPQTDISAPAKYIYTPFKTNISYITDPALREELKDGNLYKWGGATSQATAHVAAAASIWRFQHKDMLAADTYYTSRKWRIVEAFRYALYASRDIPENWIGQKKLLRNYKGVLNVEHLIDPVFAPNTQKCKEYINEIEKAMGRRRDRREIGPRFDIFAKIKDVPSKP